VNAYVASNTHPNPNSVSFATTTDGNGMWQFTGLTDANQWDVAVNYLGNVKWYKGNGLFSFVMQAANWGSQVKNTALMGPTTGANAVAAWRALVAADLPLYTTWTLVSITQNVGITITSTQYARYAQFGKFVHVMAKWTLGSGGTASNAILINLPAALAAAAGLVSVVAVVGQAIYTVAASGTFYTPSVAVGTGAQVLELIANNTTGVLGTSAFTVATSDTLAINCLYELA
jgi:hypothetical protein